jgi:hypothetical protein
MHVLKGLAGITLHNYRCEISLSTPHSLYVTITFIFASIPIMVVCEYPVGEFPNECNNQISTGFLTFPLCPTLHKRLVSRSHKSLRSSADMLLFCSVATLIGLLSSCNCYRLPFSFANRVLLKAFILYIVLLYAENTAFQWLWWLRL